MTQVKLWQIVSQTPKAIIISDADGNLQTLSAPSANQVLVSAGDGTPMWAENEALQAALQAQTDAANAIATANAYTEAQIAALVGGAPLALDTLNELAQKLNSEESALNALIAQMETKASKTEVSTQVGQAKQEAVDQSSAYTDTAVSTLGGNLSTLILQARDEAINLAAADASQKSSEAQTQAVLTANEYTDHRLTNAGNALTADADAKVNALRASIPSSFVVEGTSTACYVSTSSSLDAREAVEGMVVAERFSEVTGAAVAANDSSLKAKLVFVNGVAMADDWAVPFSDDGKLRIQFTERLAHHVFDGTENSVMVLVEHKSINAITVKS